MAHLPTYQDGSGHIATHQMEQDQEKEWHTRYTEAPVGEVGGIHCCGVATDVRPVVGRRRGQETKGHWCVGTEHTQCSGIFGDESSRI